jgi:hypothetical protein
MPSQMTADLLEALRRHYIPPMPMPGGMFLPEVTMERAGGQRVDALYIGFTSTRGHYLVGHELKVSRADWLHELAQPEKAEAWASQCHAFYLVVPDPSIVRDGELPPDWGLMKPGRSKTRMDILVKAAIHSDRTPSWTTMHSILKKADTERLTLVDDARRKERVALQDQLTQSARDLATARLEASQSRRAREVVELLENHLGLQITDRAYTFGRHAIDVTEFEESVAAYVAQRHSALKTGEQVNSHLRNTVSALERSLELIRSALAESEAQR